MCPETSVFFLATISFFYQSINISRTVWPTTLELCMVLYDTKAHFQQTIIFQSLFSTMAVIKKSLKNTFLVILKIIMTSPYYFIIYNVS